MPLHEKSKLETDNSVSNPSGNGIPEGLETKFLVFKTLVSNCVCLNSVSNQRHIRDGIIPSLIRDGFDSVSKTEFFSVSDQRRIKEEIFPSLIRDGIFPSLI